MKKVHIVGVGTGKPDLAKRHLDVIASADILVGAGRHLDLFQDHSGEKLVISSPLDNVIEKIRRAMAEKRVVVLASGDPLFYGIGRTLAGRLGEAQVEILPNVSAMAEAFARIKKSWVDAKVVSLHGRNAETSLTSALAGSDPVFIFTDRKYTPAKVAQIISERAPRRWRLWVFERLGAPEERVRWFLPMDAVNRSFQEPNSVIALPDEKATPGQKPVLGGPDDRYAHDAGMITKAEVRVVSLSSLRLEPGHVMWDIGAGSGAVSIEAAIFITRGRICAVEKHPERLENIRKNVRRFNVPQVQVHGLDLPEGMEKLPAPDRVFVGGGGAKLPEILRRVAKALNPGGRIVVNVVVIESLAECLRVLKEAGFETEVIQIQVARGKDMPAGMRLSANNPVFVVTADRAG